MRHRSNEFLESGRRSDGDAKVLEGVPASISTDRLFHGAPLRPPPPLLGRAYVRAERKQRALKYASRGDELDLSIALNFTDLGRKGGKCYAPAC